MPIDPRIPLGAQTPKINTPFENLAIVLQEERARSEAARQRMETEQRRRLMAEQSVFDQAVGRLPDFSDQSLDSLVRVAPTLGTAFRDKLIGQRKEAMAAMKAEKDMEAAEAERGFSLLGAAEALGPEAWPDIAPVIAKHLPDLAKMLPQQYDPQTLQGLRQAGVKAADQVKSDQAALAALYKGEWGAFADYVAQADDPQEREQRVQAARVAGMPKAGLDALMASPQSFAMTPAQRADDRRADVAAQALAGERRTDNARADEQLNISRQHLDLARQAGQRAAANAADGGQRPLTQTAESQMIARLSGQWTKAIANSREMERQLANMDAGIAAARRGDVPQGTEAVLQTFLKVLDPNSVVREGEFWRLREGMPVDTRVRTFFQRLNQGGFMPVGELEKFAKLAREMYEQRPDQLGPTRKRIEATAKRYNIPADLVLEELAGEKAAPTTGTDVPLSGEKPQQRPIPGVPGGVAELRNGRWIRVK